MGFLILSALKNDGGCLSGYDVIKYIYAQFRFLSSSGTVYSHLYAMERNGLLHGVQESRRRVYGLTSKGLRLLERLRGLMVAFRGLWQESFRVEVFVLVGYLDFFYFFHPWNFCWHFG